MDGSVPRTPKAFLKGFHCQHYSCNILSTFEEQSTTFQRLCVKFQDQTDMLKNENSPKVLKNTTQIQ